MESKDTKSKKVIIYLFISIFGLLATIIFAAGFGDVRIPIGEFIQILLSKIPGISGLIDTSSIIDSHQKIVLDLRLPRIILSLFAGFGLAYAGVIYQGVFKNAMAEPYLLGISSGAALGATIASVFPISIRFFGFGYVSILAFFGSLIVLNIIFGISNRKSGLTINILLLSGLAINYFISSMISLIMMFNQEQLSEVYFWTMGSFKGATYEKIIIVATVVIITVIVTYPSHKNLDIMLLGDEQALSLGVDVARTKKRLLVISSLMTAVIVASCGIIGFVGLIIPHLVRLFVGPTHKKVLVLSAILGGIFLVFSDTLARSLINNKEISTGIITAIVGVPFFIYMLVNKRSKI